MPVSVDADRDFAYGVDERRNCAMFARLPGIGHADPLTGLMNSVQHFKLRNSRR